MVLSRIRPWLVWVLLACAAQVQAGGSYRVEMQLPTGDTISLAGLTDAGDILLSGYGDSCSGGKSFVVNRGGQALPGFVLGLPSLDDAYCGVQVDSLNSSGDMLGASYRDNQWVSTFWRDGLAHDLRDPANAGLAFVPDPGAHRITLDLSALDIVDVPTWIRQGSDFYLSSQVYTNALGEFAAESRTYFYGGALLVPLTVPVPEPATSALMLVGLAGLAAGLGVSRR